MKTFEEIALDKLEELGDVTAKEWAEALGYKTLNAFYHTFNKLRKSGQIIETTSVRPRKYKVNDRKTEVSQQ